MRLTTIALIIMALVASAMPSYARDYESPYSVELAAIPHPFNPPVTSIAISGPRLDYYGWYTYISDSTQISFSAVDNGQVPPGATTYYRIDSGSLTPYAGPFTLGSHPDGQHYISFYSVNSLGDMEYEQYATIVLDSTAPTDGTLTARVGINRVTLNWDWLYDDISGVA